MAPIVSRLEGESLGLTIHPGPTFALLPLEIRNNIYELLLIAYEPIIVFGTLAPTLLTHPLGPQEHEKVKPLTFGLLWVSRAISIEAAAIFYRHNVFKFGGSTLGHLSDTWDPLYCFLLTIGERNRAHLQYLEADIGESSGVTKDATTGTIISYVKRLPWMRRVHARDTHARIYPPAQHGCLSPTPMVNYISPAIEAVFRILGSEGSRIRLSLSMNMDSFPGSIVGDDGLLYGWSCEVPDYVEHMRKRFTSSPGGEARVDVLWKGTGFKSHFLLRFERFEKEGWELLEMEDIVKLPLNEYGPICTRFVLRKHITFRTDTIIHPEALSMVDESQY